MSIHNAFRRQPVPQELAVRYATTTLPAPIRGLSLIENWAYVKPGSANVLDNWFPTQKGLRLRGGSERWSTLPAPVEPVRSGFEYISGGVQRMYGATNTRLFDLTFADAPSLVTGIGTITDGNFSAAQLANSGGDWLLICNDVGDYVRRYDGTTWTYLNAGQITGPPPAPAAVLNGHGLTYVWKYRNRLFFIQCGTMNAYCLPLNAVGGALVYIPLSGAFKRGGSLLFGASWSIDAGDGIDDKCAFFTDQGEVAIFTGTDPTSSTNWSQQGRYDISRPTGGKNGHQQLGGDVLVVTVDGVVPLSACLSKDVAQLSLAAVTLPIEPMWMEEFRNKDVYPWPIAKWDEGDMLLVSFAGGVEYNTKTIAVSNLHTSAWARFVGWDALCFMKLRGNLFFGTQDGKIIQCESTGYDDAIYIADWQNSTSYAVGVKVVDPVDNTFWLNQVVHTSAAAGTFAADRAAHPTYWALVPATGRYTGSTYVCSMIGGWEMFQAPPNQVTWFQARANFFSSAREPFQPQLAACVDYQFRLPAPPPAGPDPGLLDLWDQGLWDQALWDQPQPGLPPAKNTMWCSIGETGFSHAPIVQVTVGQQVKPRVELISISATFLRMGVNV